MQINIRVLFFLYFTFSDWNRYIDGTMLCAGADPELHLRGCANLLEAGSNLFRKTSGEGRLFCVYIIRLYLFQGEIQKNIEWGYKIINSAEFRSCPVRKCETHLYKSSALLFLSTHTGD